ncbi:hypothetical protein GCM10010123_06950 [Pilimelia anulata]|uniref:Uncharacterized protein n=1 Tax=Pilimelia anulata TaxID=53371 RepID=A0A8J3F8M4_9ACTN|nr:hypothetical protein [Pilimelia anulata]GGJ79768.1 hypothetical protein GCM10010123_06950 [Pilimelia anulata]
MANPGNRLRRLAAACAAVVVALAAPTPAAAAPQPVSPQPAERGRSAIYGGGPFYSDGQAVMDTLRSSGFTTVILWAIHVHDNGDLYYNDHRIVADGRYIGDAGWPNRLRTLKQAPTSVDRIEVSVGSAGPNDWAVIRKLIAAGGTGEKSILYRNFAALKSATGADALNNDDEAEYHLDSTVAFARMGEKLGYRFTFVPYTNRGFWRSLKSNLGGLVDRVYLQNYAGGQGNDPAAWGRDLGLPVDPGLWSRHGSGCREGDSPDRVRSRMKSWQQSAGIVGGFMWLYDDMKACAREGSPAAYAEAINGI